MRSQVRKAFTLVEILIVVVILGILAAIVVPQFTSATQDAQGGNVTTQLETINTQVELFRARTGASNQDLEDLFDGVGWTFLISGGNLPSNGVAFEGNYLKAEPRNPRFSDTTLRSAIIGPGPFDPLTGIGGANNAGWYYYYDANNNFSIGAAFFNKETGQIDPNMYP